MCVSKVPHCRGSQRQPTCDFLASRPCFWRFNLEIQRRKGGRRGGNKKKVERGKIDRESIFFLKEEQFTNYEVTFFFKHLHLRSGFFPPSVSKQRRRPETDKAAPDVIFFSTS